MKRRRCCIIFNQPGDGALPDELDVLDQVEYVGNNLGKLGIDTYRKGITRDFMNEIALLKAEAPDFVFNLVESVNNKGELCYFIPALLNLYSIPYTGNPLEAMFITTSKALTGNFLSEHDVKSPAIYFPSQSSSLVKGNRYIIKPVWEDGSQDITSDSVFVYSDAMEQKLKEYNDSHWIIQDFIDGREFNISVISGQNGPDVMPPAEMVFQNYDDHRPKIVDFKAKWIEGSFEYENTVRNFPGKNLDPVLNDKIRDTALKCWHLFRMKGYARVDMRVDKDGEPYVIEVNANPCMSPDSGLIAATNEAGITITELLMRIISDLNI